MRLLIYTDGAARGNPGPAGAGAILRDADGRVVAEIAEPLGRATNNVAEWTAVLLALEEARRLGATHVDLRMDSELVARQISGIYKVKHPDLKPIHAAAMELLRSFDGYTVGHVPRELNKDADRLSNVAIDGPADGHRMDPPDEVFTRPISMRMSSAGRHPPGYSRAARHPRGGRSDGERPHPRPAGDIEPSTSARHKSNRCSNRVDFRSLEAAGWSRAHRSKGRVRGKSELLRAG